MIAALSILSNRSLSNEVQDIFIANRQNVKLSTVCCN